MAQAPSGNIGMTARHWSRSSPPRISRFSRLAPPLRAVNGQSSPKRPATTSIFKAERVSIRTGRMLVAADEVWWSLTIHRDSCPLRRRAPATNPRRLASHRSACGTDSSLATGVTPWCYFVDPRSPRRLPSSLCAAVVSVLVDHDREISCSSDLAANGFDTHRALPERRRHPAACWSRTGGAGEGDKHRSPSLGATGSLIIEPATTGILSPLGLPHSTLTRLRWASCANLPNRHTSAYSATFGDST